MKSDINEKYQNKSVDFVNYVIGLCAPSANKGVAAALRRADNANTEYQSWQYLAPFVDLEKQWEREPFALIAASVAKAKVTMNGSAGIGQALASCYDDGSESDQAKTKLRRLLACDSVAEACRILRPLLNLIHGKAKVTLDFSRLLQQLSAFNWDQEKVKAQWAQNFYNKKIAAEEKTVGGEP